ncbi:streptogrisin C [Saccharothrix coeruleofusca]|uniref:trypsin-like serine protease n=1 Tax=Saccharothrix coeruleofusca TaxID=33919 RepID=UPI0027DDF6B3|nr:trypsin-like serine protease [Saccharothrix coeruleofusca]MBP2337890.1 streptogrisin C [Saccharothrix coeruleofusca]
MRTSGAGPLLTALSLGAAAAAALAFTGVVGPPRTATTAATATTSTTTSKPSVHRPLDPAAVNDSLRYLVQTFGVDQAEALRRLELQQDAVRLDAVLREKASAAYGGMWVDHDAGGVLVVAATGQAGVEPHLDLLPSRQHVRVQPVARSLADLTAVRDRIAAKVGTGPEAAHLPAISEPENRVVLWARTWVANRITPLSARAQLAENARQAVAAEGEAAVARNLPEPRTSAQPSAGPTACGPLACAAPMRGGMRLDIRRDNGTRGGCTSGFNLRSTGGQHHGRAWVLTAGHCTVGKTNNRPVQHNGADVLQQHGIEENSYPYDYAALPYAGDAATAWLESAPRRNLVLGSKEEPITGTHALTDIKAGWVVCAAGSASSAADFPDSVDSGAGAGYSPGTRCGRVLSTDVGINTDICARAGDSGGPLFNQADHTALGILEGSQQARTGACQPDERNNYVPISTVLGELDARGQGSTFAVITAPNG